NGPWETYREDLESKADGLVSTEVDKAGFYRFIETEAPDGFILFINFQKLDSIVMCWGCWSFWLDWFIFHRSSIKECLLFTS
ncbi:hypothetical protein, partial [Lactococcus petauri]|uniref:hypothetical protein n=1 Tax=Lactococcus petauri TaxID=1940789 RepID=UPI00255187DB